MEHNDHERRLTLLEENDKVQDKRLETHGREIDKLFEIDSQQNIDMAIMKKDLENIDRTTKKIDDSIGAILNKSYTNANGILSAIIKVAVGIFIAGFIYWLFPHIK